VTDVATPATVVDDGRRRWILIATIIGPSMTFVDRLNKLAVDPPGDDWDGSWRLTQK